MLPLLQACPPPPARGGRREPSSWPRVEGGERRPSPPCLNSRLAVTGPACCPPLWEHPATSEPGVSAVCRLRERSEAKAEIRGGRNEFNEPNVTGRNGKE